MSWVRLVAPGLLALVSCSQGAAPPGSPPAPQLGLVRQALGPAPSGEAADLFFGQPNAFANRANTVDATGLSGPLAVALDESVSPPRLYVADTSNHRVLMWKDATRFGTFVPADLVLGQVDFFTVQVRGPSATSFWSPEALAVDADGNLYVADTNNHRVLEFDSPATSDRIADRVFGQYGNLSTRGCSGWFPECKRAPDYPYGYTEAETLFYPAGLAVDRSVRPNRLFVSDGGDHRVLRFDAPLQNSVPQAAFGQSAMNLRPSGKSATGLTWPRGIAFDPASDSSPPVAGRLYVADTGNNRVLALDNARTFTTGASAAAVFGQLGSFATSFINAPTTTAAGTREGMRAPTGVAVDGLGNLYVADAENNRVLAFLDPMAQGSDGLPDEVLGQPTYEASAANYDLSSSTLIAPRAVFADANGNLVVADSGVNRVLYFEKPLQGTADTVADAVFGQGGMNWGAPNSLNGSSLNAPTGILVDRGSTPNRVYVADAGNNRVLAWADEARFRQGAAASLVLGKPDPLSSGCHDQMPRSAATLCDPRGLAVNAAGDLFVVDGRDARVLIYDDPFAPGEDLEADALVGYASWSAVGNGACYAINDASLCWPQGIAVDASGALYVSDTSYHRVLVFEPPFLAPPEVNKARRVFGQVGMTGASPNALGAGSYSSLFLPGGLAFDEAGRLYIADQGNGRVVVHETPGLDTTGDRAITVASRLGFHPKNVTAWDGHLYVADWHYECWEECNTDEECWEVCDDANRYSRVLRFEPGVDDQVKQIFGAPDLATPSFSNGPNAFANAHSVAVNAQGGVFIADNGNHRVAIFLTNRPPRALELALAPARPTCLDDLLFTWRYEDPDGDPKDPAKTVLRWYRDGLEQPGLLNALQAPRALLRKGDWWHVIVWPSDGVELGAPATSALVQVANSLPSASGLTLTPAAPRRSDTLTADWVFSDADSLDLEGAPSIRWLRNGQAQPALANSRTVPSGTTRRDERWAFEVAPFDGTDYGARLLSPAVIVVNTPPAASDARVEPASPSSSDTLAARYVYEDPDGDREAGSVLRWFRDGVEQAGLQDRAELAPEEAGLAEGQRWRFSIEPKDGVELGPRVDSSNEVVVRPSPPLATNLAIDPPSPISSQTLTASWRYLSRDGRPQAGSTLRWFRDGVEQKALLGSATVSRLARGEVWQFKVVPSDGVQQGPEAASPEATVLNSPPVASNLTVQPSPARSLQPLVGSYAYADADLDPEQGTRIQWLRNGVAQPHLDGQLTVPADEVLRGDSWQLAVTPGDGRASGATATSLFASIGNTAPSASGLRVEPAEPRAGQTLRAVYTYSDPEGDPESGSRIAWQQEGVPVPELAGSETVPGNLVIKGKGWSFSVEPRDGLDFGAVAQSGQVRVANTPPAALDLAFDPPAPRTGEALRAAYRFVDADGDVESGSELRWYKNGVEVATLRNSPGVAGREIQRGDLWRFSVRPRDGAELGAVATLSPLAIGNQPPAAANARIGPAGPGLPNHGSALTADWDYADPEQDLQSGSRIRWFKGANEQPGFAGWRTLPVAAAAKNEVWRFVVEPGDGSGLFGPAVESPPVVIANSPPIAQAGDDVPIYPTGALTLVTLDGSASQDPDGDRLQFRWTEGTVLLDDGNATPTLALAPGAHVITLVVFDGEASTADEVVVTITDPVITVQAEPDLVAGPPGRVALRATGYDTLDRELVYVWRQVSGPPAELAGGKLEPDGSFVSDRSEISVFAVATGEVQLQVVARTLSGASQSEPDTVRIRVENLPPFPAWGGRLVTRPGLEIVLDGSESSDPNGDPLEFTWSLVDEAAGRLEDAGGPRARFTPSAEGRARIMLTVREQGSGLEASAVGEILSIEPAVAHDPVAEAGPDLVVEVGARALLDGSASYDLDGGALAYRWRQVAVGSEPPLALVVLGAQASFVAAAAGEYRIGLTLSDGARESEEDLVVVRVIDPSGNHAPVARVGRDLLSRVGALVTLDGGRSGDPDGDVPLFEWRQTWGPMVTLLDPDTAHPSFVALRPGLLRFELVLRDASAQSAPAAMWVVITAAPNRPPLASAGPDQILAPRRPAQLDGSLSSDADADVLAYSWRQVAGPPVVLEGLGGARPSFTPVAAGLYRFQLQVSDGQVTSLPDSVEVRVLTHAVENRAPIAAAGEDRDVAPGATVSLDGSASSDPDGDALFFLWEVVGFPGEQPPVIAEPGQAAIAFVAETAGVYTLRLTVSDGELTGSAYLSVRAGAVRDAQDVQRCGCASGGSGSLLVGLLGWLGLSARRAWRRRAAGGAARRAGLLGAALALVALGCQQQPKQPAPARTASASKPLSVFPLDTRPELVMGQPDFLTITPNQPGAAGLYGPRAVALDASSTPPRVYVADTLNNRVLGWLDAAGFTNGKAADLVIGQPDFTVSACLPAADDSLCGPTALAVDGDGNLFVVDPTYHRVVGYRKPAASFPKASWLFGQATWSGDRCNQGGTTGAGTLCAPSGVAAVPSSGKILVSDSANHRVLRFPKPLAGGPVAQAAEAVFGQVDFVANTANRIDSRQMWAPSGVAIDRTVTPNRLYVADRNHHRVLGWANVDSLVTGKPADLVIGQPTAHDLRPNAGGLVSRFGLNEPTHLAVDPRNGDLWVADYWNRRLLRFDSPFTTTDPGADALLGQATYSETGIEWDSNLETASVYGMAVGPDGVLAVAGSMKVRLFQPPFDGSLQARTPDTTFVGALSPQSVQFDAAGRLWIGDHNSRSYIALERPVAGEPWDATPDFVLPKKIPDQPAYAFAIAANGDLWEFGWSSLFGYRNPLGTGDLVSDAAPERCPPPDTGTCLGNAGQSGAAVDSRGRLYFSDTYNNRVLVASDPFSGRVFDIMLGQMDYWGSLYTVMDGGGLNSPAGLAVDPRDNLLYVADRDNHRVLSLPDPGGFATGADATRVFGQLDFMTWTSDRVRQYDSPDATTLSSPTAVAVDPSGNLFVSETVGQRVLEFDRPATGDTSADRVFGQNGFNQRSCPARLAEGLCAPQGLAANAAGLFVAHPDGNRVVWFQSPIADPAVGGTPDKVLGPPSLSSTAANGVRALRLNGPQALALDRRSTPVRVYLADTGNHRILAWSDEASFRAGAAPNLILGQSSPTGSDCNAGGVGAATLCSPWGLTVDARGDLWVADRDNSRVLRFDSPFAGTPQSAVVADLVLGQSSMTANACNEGPWPYYVPNEWRLCLPQSVAVDPSGNVLVVDAGNNRMLRYARPPAPGDFTNGMAASLLVGQAAYYMREGNAYTVAADTLRQPASVWVDSAGYTYVGDTGACRLDIFRSPLDPAADFLLGQPNLWTGTNSPGNWGCGAHANAIGGAAGIVGFGANLYVAEPALNRVVRFEEPLLEVTIDQYFGQATTAASSCNRGGLPGPETLCRPGGVEVDRAGGLYIVDSGNNRVLAFVSNRVPSISRLQLAPAFPLDGQELVASYEYSDPDGHPENGTRIHWHEDGAHRPVYDGLLRVPGSAVHKGHRWHLTVEPSDGVEAGAVVTSETITVGNSAPVATEAGLQPASPKAGEALLATWRYSDPDGDPEPLAGAAISWFKDGIEQGQFANLATARAGRRGESWYFKVAPFDGADFGAMIKSPSVEVIDTKPVASSARITPSAPTSSDRLTASYAYSDADGDLEGSTRISWHRNGSATPAATGRTLTLPLAKGESWHVVVVPSDGTLEGDPIQSAPVVVAGAPPEALDLSLTPRAPSSSDRLTASWRYSSPDGTAQSGSELGWHRNRVRQDALGGATTLDGQAGDPCRPGLLVRGDEWFFTVRPRDAAGLEGALAQSDAVIVGNSAPTASGLAISPATPRTEDDLIAEFSICDRDGDPEQKSSIRWFRNGVEQPLLANQKTVPSSATSSKDSWYFLLRPGDGVALGPEVAALPRVIGNTAPGASAARIDPAAPRASDTLRAVYVYSDVDADPEAGSEIRWFRTPPAGLEQPVPALDNQRSVAPALLARGQRWRFTVRPRDGAAFGPEIASEAVTLGNSAPAVSGLAIAPAQPLAGAGLIASYQYADLDGDAEAGTAIRWWRNNEEVTGLAGQLQVPAGTTVRNETWTLSIQPSDGTDAGGEIWAAPVTIGNRPPSVSGLEVGPAAPRTTDVLEARYGFSDPDGDANAGSTIRWFKDGVPQAGLDDRTQVPALTASRGERWRFSVRPSDGKTAGEEQTSPETLVLNSAPVARAGIDRIIVPTTDPANVTLDGSKSSDADARDVLSFSWAERVGEGLEPRATGQRPTLLLGVGVHTLRLTVGDGTDQSTDDLVVDVRDPQPEIAQLQDLAVQPGLVELEVTAREPLQRPLAYAWAQVDGLPVDLKEADTPQPWFFATAAGERTFRVEVSNTVTGRSTSAQVRVTIAGLPPFAGWLPRAVLARGESVTLDGQLSRDPNGDPLAWSWEVDGLGTLSSATEANPTLTAAEDGVCEVRLTVSDAQYTAGPARGEILVVDSSRSDHVPRASAGPDLLAQVGVTTVLDGSGSRDADGGRLQYRWTLESGPLAVQGITEGPRHTFVPGAEGVYRFALEVSDGTHQSAVDTVEVFATDPEVNRWPTARAQIACEGCAAGTTNLVRSVDVGAEKPAPIVLDGSGSKDADGDSLTYRWRQVWGAPVVLKDGDTARPSFMPLVPGLLRFELRVSDGHDLEQIDDSGASVRRVVESAPAEVTVQLVSGANVPPVAAFRLVPSTSERGSGEVLLNERVALNGSESRDENGDPLTFYWEQVLGAPVPLTDRETDTASLVVRAVGRHKFRLYVSDGQVLSLPAELEFVVRPHGTDNKRPTAVAELKSGGRAGEPVELDGSKSEDPDPYDELLFRWSFVGFPTGLEPELQGATTATPKFVATAPGQYALRLVVSDGDLTSDPVFLQVRVELGAGQEEEAGFLGVSCGSAVGGPALGALVALALALSRRRRR